MTDLTDYEKARALMSVLCIRIAGWSLGGFEGCLTDMCHAELRAIELACKHWV
jgi:hypothetical protein